jgi:hypothetical protein
LGAAPAVYALCHALADWFEGGSQVVWAPNDVVRPVLVVGEERFSEADLCLFCAILRALSLGDSDATNRDQLKSILAGTHAVLVGLHVFASEFYIKLIDHERGEGQAVLVNVFVGV